MRVSSMYVLLTASRKWIPDCRYFGIMQHPCLCPPISPTYTYIQTSALSSFSDRKPLKISCVKLNIRAVKKYLTPKLGARTSRWQPTRGMSLPGSLASELHTFGQHEYPCWKSLHRRVECLFARYQISKYTPMIVCMARAWFKKCEYDGQDKNSDERFSFLSTRKPKNSISIKEKSYL